MSEKVVRIFIQYYEYRTRFIWDTLIFHYSSIIDLIKYFFQVKQIKDPKTCTQNIKTKSKTSQEKPKNKAAKNVKKAKQDKTSKVNEEVKTKQIQVITLVTKSCNTPDRKGIILITILISFLLYIVFEVFWAINSGQIKLMFIGSCSLVYKLTTLWFRGVKFEFSL